MAAGWKGGSHRALATSQAPTGRKRSHVPGRTALPWTNAKRAKNASTAVTPMLALYVAIGSQPGWKPGASTATSRATRPTPSDSHPAVQYAK